MSRRIRPKSPLVSKVTGGVSGLGGGKGFRTRRRLLSIVGEMTVTVNVPPTVTVSLILALILDYYSTMMTNVVTI